VLSAPAGSGRSCKKMHSVLIYSILGLTLLGMPIGYSLGVSTLLALLYSGSFPLILIPQHFMAGIDSFPIMAIPFFILAGNLMTAGGINQKLIGFCNTLVGWVTGSLAMVTVVASMFFAAISGSAVATVAAIGGITIPAMKKENYPAGFAAAVSSAAGVCGPIIPPSIPLIVYGSALSMSISDLFLASVVPGIILGVVLCATAYVISKKRNFPKHERAPKGAAFESGARGVLGFNYAPYRSGRHLFRALSRLRRPPFWRWLCLDRRGLHL
jgi:TRAP-type C4-dicarboxylate transport system, large permease component